MNVIHISIWRHFRNAKYLWCVFGLEESWFLKTYGFTSVRPSVRTNFSQKSTHQIFLIFSWSPGLVTVKKWQFRFLAENSKLALFWPKMVQNWPFLAKTAQNQCFLLIFSFFWFFSWSLGFMNVKKCLFRFFVENSLPIHLPKNSISLSFDLILTPNFLIGYFIWNSFSQVLFQYFRLLCGTCDQILAHFRGLCCVKMTKNSSKSIFFNRFKCFFNVFICHPGPCDLFVGPFRGSCCEKMTKNSSKSTFIEPFDLVMTGNFVYFFFIGNMYSRLLI